MGNGFEQEGTFTAGTPRGEAKRGFEAGGSIWGGGAGRGNCAKMLGSQSPPRDGCPKGVVRWRETWSGCYAKVREVARKSAKVHESSHRSGPWLRDVTHCYGWELFFCGRDE